MKEKEHERVLEFRNEIEARLVTSHLDDEGIPYQLVSNHDSAYDGIFQVQMGWGHLLAPAEYAGEIQQIYDDLVSGT
jgi:hypothetical protein